MECFPEAIFLVHHFGRSLLHPLTDDIQVSFDLNQYRKIPQPYLRILVLDLALLRLAGVSFYIIIGAYLKVLEKGIYYLPFIILVEVFSHFRINLRQKSVELSCLGLIPVLDHLLAVRWNFLLESLSILPQVFL